MPRSSARKAKLAALSMRAQFGSLTEQEKKERERLRAEEKAEKAKRELASPRDRSRFRRKR